MFPILFYVFSLQKRNCCTEINVLLLWAYLMKQKQKLTFIIKKWLSFFVRKTPIFFVMISWCYNVLPKSLTRVLLVNTKAIENRVSGWQTRSSIKKYHLKKAWITYIHPWNSVTGERLIFQKWYKCKQHWSRSCQTRKAPENKSSGDCSAIFKNHVMVTHL